jgi:hypothetical protein
LGSQAESCSGSPLRSVMTNRIPLQNGFAERSAVIRIRLEGRGCRPNRSQSILVDPLGSSESFGVLSWAPRQSRQVVRRRDSVMTNRILSQDGVAERSPVLQIHLDGRGCRPDHPHPTQSLARVPGWNRGWASSRSACSGAQDWQAAPPDRKEGCVQDADPLSTQGQSSPDGLLTGLAVDPVSLPGRKVR